MGAVRNYAKTTKFCSLSLAAARPTRDLFIGSRFIGWR